MKRKMNSVFEMLVSKVGMLRKDVITFRNKTKNKIMSAKAKMMINTPHNFARQLHFKTRLRIASPPNLYRDARSLSVRTEPMLVRIRVRV